MPRRGICESSPHFPFHIVLACIKVIIPGTFCETGISPRSAFNIWDNNNSLSATCLHTFNTYMHLLWTYDFFDEKSGVYCWALHITLLISEWLIVSSKSRYWSGSRKQTGSLSKAEMIWTSVTVTRCKIIGNGEKYALQRKAARMPILRFKPTVTPAALDKVQVF